MINSSPFYKIISSNAFHQRKCFAFVVCNSNYPGGRHVAAATWPCTHLFTLRRVNSTLYFLLYVESENLAVTFLRAIDDFASSDDRIALLQDRLFAQPSTESVGISTRRWCWCDQLSTSQQCYVNLSGRSLNARSMPNQTIDRVIVQRDRPIAQIRRSFVTS